MTTNFYGEWILNRRVIHSFFTYQIQGVQDTPYSEM